MAPPNDRSDDTRRAHIALSAGNGCLAAAMGSGWQAGPGQYAMMGRWGIGGDGCKKPYPLILTNRKQGSIGVVFICTGFFRHSKRSGYGPETDVFFKLSVNGIRFKANDIKNGGVMSTGY